MKGDQIKVYLHPYWFYQDMDGIIQNQLVFQREKLNLKTIEKNNT